MTRRTCPGGGTCCADACERTCQALGRPDNKLYRVVYDAESGFCSVWLTWDRLLRHLTLFRTYYATPGCRMRHITQRGWQVEQWT